MNKIKDLEDKHIFITGGGSGVGASIVEGFLKQNAKVSFIDIDKNSTKLCNLLHNKYKYNPLFIKADLTNDTQLQNAINQALNDVGDIEVLINNAANDIRHNLQNTTSQFWMKI